MDKITIEVEDLSKVSDGFHTMQEIYDHRCALFLALMKSRPSVSWFSLLHDNGKGIEGWFVAGIELPTGQVTYHLPNSMWEMAIRSRADCRMYAPKWDGHTSAEALERIENWVLGNY